MLSIRNTKISSLPLLFSLMMMGLLVSSCGKNSATTSSNSTSTSNEDQQAQSNLSGDINVDGSSTVFPITEAIAEDFQGNNPKVKIAIGVSGTGGGFKKFCAGETDISNASRPIKDSEIELCKQSGIEYIELPVAFDALSVVVNPENNWASCLTVEELNKIWNPEAQGKINNWQQVRSSFPDLPLNLFGPGTDSGTFDYFTEAINGKGGVSRGDYTASEDDNVIVQGVTNDKGALGYFGLSYLEENLASVKGISIDDGDPNNGDGCIEPSVATVEEGTYQPLARPLFIYVNKASLQNPQVKEFVSFYLDNDNNIIEEVGYINLPDGVSSLVAQRFKNETTGTIFAHGSSVGVKLSEALK